MEKLGIGVTINAIFLLGTLTYGWALMTLWAWFVVPTFKVPTLSLALAIGLSLTIRLFTYQGESEQESSPRKPWTDVIMNMIGKSIVSPGFAVLYG